MFSPDQITAEVQKQLNSGSIAIPDGHRIAVITHSDGKSITATVAYKPSKDWVISGIYDWSHDSGTQAGFNVQWSK